METKEVEDMIRDLVNIINVRKEEEVEGATQKIEDDTAVELVKKLEKIAKAVGQIKKWGILFILVFYIVKKDYNCCNIKVKKVYILKNYAVKIWI